MYEEKSHTDRSSKGSLRNAYFDSRAKFIQNAQSKQTRGLYFRSEIKQSIREDKNNEADEVKRRCVDTAVHVNRKLHTEKHVYRTTVD